MTTVIDERVVEMRFNNEDFERNVKESMSTLEKLKNSLNFDSANSLKELGEASKKFSLSGITETITEATSKFSALEIAGITAISNITNKVVDMGISLVKSLSIDQVTSGFDKYAEKTSAVQTIIAATGKSIEFVEGQMEKLNWFTDETSYNFSDMANNIGKFTSNGVELEKAASAMQGIATWAARSGQNAMAASRVMYNFSQALGTGAMMVKDWMSIENANMATKEFKQTALETAVELGKLNKVGEETYQTIGGELTFSVNEFRDSLQKKWFSTDVMIETLNRYNQYAEELYALTEKTGRTATQLMIDAEAYADGTLEIEKVAKSSKMSVEELSAAYESLNSETNKLSREAFKNAQEAKTFKEVMDATADAVSTGWMNTFQYIFGNYEEAKALWSGMANAMITLFTATGTARNEILGFWKDLGGRESLIRAFVQLVNNIARPINQIILAFKSLIPDTEGLGNKLYDLTNKFKELMERLEPSHKLLVGIRATFLGLFTVMKMLGKIFVAVIKAVFPVTDVFGSLLEMIFTVTGYVGAFIAVIGELADELGVFDAITATLRGVFQILFNIIKGVGLVALYGLVTTIKLAISVIGILTSKVSSFIKNSKLLRSIISAVNKTFNKFKNFITGLSKPIETVNKVTVKMKEYFGESSDSAAEFGTVVKDAADNVKKSTTPLQKVVNVLKLVGTTILQVAKIVAGVVLLIGTSIFKFFENLFAKFREAGENSNSLLDVIKGIFTTIGDVLSDVGGKVSDFLKDMGIDLDGLKGTFSTVTDKIKEFVSAIDAGSVVAIVLSVALLSVIGAAVSLTDKIGTLAQAASGVFTNINKLLKKQFAKTNVMTDIAKSIALIAGSIALLTFVDQDKLKRVSAIMAGFIVLVGALTITLEALANKFKSLELSTNLRAVSATIISLAGSMLVMAAAMAVLSKIKIENPEDFEKIVGIMAGLLAYVALIGTLMSRFSKSLPKGSILLLALAFSMRQIVKALDEMTNLPLVSINWGAYLAVFTGIAAVVAASGQIKLSSAVGILILAKALQMIFPALADIITEIGKLPFETMAQAATKNIKAIVIFTIGAVASLATVIIAIKALKKKATALSTQLGGKSGGGIFGGIGGTFAGIGIGIALIVHSLKTIHNVYDELKDGELQDIAKFMLQLIGALTAVAVVIPVIDSLMSKSDKFGTGKTADFAKMALMFVGLGAALRLMASAVKVLEGLDSGKMILATGALVAMGMMLAIIANVVAQVPNAKAAIATLIASVVAIGVLVGELAVLYLFLKTANVNDLLDSFVVLGGIIGAMYLMMKVLSQVKDVKTGPVVAMVVGIGLICAALVIVSRQPWYQIVAAGAAIAGCIGMLALVTNQLGKISTNNVKTNSIVAIAITIGAIGVALEMASRHNWKQIAAAGATMVIALGAVAGVLEILDHIGSKGGQLSAAGSIALIGFALVEIGYALNLLKDIQLGDAAAKIAAILGIIGGLIVLVGLISSIKTIGQLFMLGMLAFATSVTLVCSAFSLLAISIPIAAQGLDMLADVLDKMASLPFDILAPGLVLLGGGLAAVGVGCALIAVGAIALAALAFALAQLALALPTAATGLQMLVPALQEFSTLPFEVLGKGLVQVAIGLGAIGLACIPISIAAFGIAAMGLALTALSIALPIAAVGIQMLVPALQAFSTLPFDTIVPGLLGVAGGLIAVGVGGVAVGLGAIGMGALAIALVALGLTAPIAAAGLNTLADVPLISIAVGILAIGSAAAVLGFAAPLIIAASVALGGLGVALSLLGTGLDAAGNGLMRFVVIFSATVQAIKIKVIEIKNAIKELFTDMAAAFEGGPAGKVIQAAAGLGEKLAGDKHTGKGLIGAVAKALDWGCPVGFIEDDLYPDMAIALESDKGIVSAAESAGTNVGNGLGESMATSISSWLSGIGDAISGFFSQFSSEGFSGIIGGFTGIGDSAEGAADKTKKSGGIVESVFDWVGGTAKKVTDKFGEFEDGLGNVIDSEDFLSDITKDLTDSMEGATDGAFDLSEGLDATGSSAGKASESLKDFKSSLAETIEGQLDMFTKFEMKSEVSADQMLENMRSNIDGMASWSHRMTVLAERGIDQGLLQKLAELGPKGYETMNAFYQMTEEQLQEANSLWATGLTLPESQSSIVASAFTYAGEMAVQGFSNALDDHKAAHAAAQGLGQAAIDGVDEKLGIASPSKVMTQKGFFVVAGLQEGMMMSSSDTLIGIAVRHVCKTIIDLFDENLSPEAMGTVGESLLSNIFTNILGDTYEDESNPIVTAFVESLANFEPVREAITTFVTLIKTEFELGLQTYEGAPSLVFVAYGKSSVVGFANGITTNVMIANLAIMSFAFFVKATLTAQNIPTKFYEIGKNATLGFANGIGDSAAAAAVITAAEAIAKKATETMQKALDSHSPSRVTMQIGEFASEGFAIGIIEGATNVYKAAERVAEEGINGMTDSTGRLSDILDSELDLNPVITPMLDLSIVRSQLSDLRSMMDSGMIGANGQNRGTFSGNPNQGTQISFTQNNYSPKELSRIDIYRNTKNQLNMMKGVVKANA